MAVVAVAVLLVAGTLNGYPGPGASPWRGLWDTTYGLLLLAKIGLVLPLLALGAFNNRYSVPRLRARIASTLEHRRFMRSAGAELVDHARDRGRDRVPRQRPARTHRGRRCTARSAMEVDFDGQLMAHLAVDPGTPGRTTSTWSSRPRGGPPS